MKLPKNYVKRCRQFEKGQKRYLYDNRAEDNVCLAHILKVLPHPEDEDERLIVYRWFGKHKRHWWYGVTETWVQDIWAEHCKKVIKLRKERKKDHENERNTPYIE